MSLYDIILMKVSMQRPDYSGIVQTWKQGMIIKWR